MNVEKKHISISKFLSLVLRHHPQVIGISLDTGGWTDVDVLLQKMQEKGWNINREILEDVLATNPKQRFSLNEDRTRIKANQGHSVTIDLLLEPLAPPQELYHGTAEKFLAAIVSEGLKKMQRHHVHLSPDVHSAFTVGKRHGKPVVLAVQSQQMYSDGFVFYRSDNGVWLTDHVPAAYLRPWTTPVE